MPATEPPFSGEYVDTKEDGTYHCAGCGAELFDSSTKFDSGTGWPSFTEPAVAEAVELRDGLEPRHGADRGRLPQLRRAPGPRLRRRPRPTGQRYCINSLALDLNRAVAAVVGAGSAGVAMPAPTPATPMSACRTLSSVFTGTSLKIESPSP